MQEYKHYSALSKASVTKLQLAKMFKNGKQWDIARTKPSAYMPMGTKQKEDEPCAVKGMRWLRNCTEE